MNTLTIHCPYCNFQLIRPAGAESGTRLACPRCGERFQYRTTGADNSSSLPPRPGVDERLRAGISNEPISPKAAESLSGDVPQPIPPQPRLPVSNRAIAFAVLGVMAFMALLGGVYAWRTVLMRRLDDFNLPKNQSIDVPLIARIALGVYVLTMAVMVLRGWNRREHNLGTTGGKARWGQFGVPALALMVLLGVGLALVAIQQRPVRGPLPGDKAGPESVAAVLPSKLAALEYLPDDVHLVVGFHVAEAWRTPAGRPFLDGSRQGGGGLGLDQIESLSGLKLAELDHAVLAMKLDKLLPRFFLIVRTIQPYVPLEIQNDLKATKVAGVDSRTLYEFEMNQVGGKAGLWFAEDKKTLVVAWPSTDMKEVPDKPREALNHLPRDMHGLFKDELDPAAKKAPVQMWTVAHVDSWDKLPAHLFLAVKFKDAWPPMSKIKTAGVWAQLGEDADLHSVCGCADGPAAEKLRAFLQPDNPAANQGLDTLFPKNSLMAADLMKTLKVTQDGERLSLEAKVNAATIQKAMGTGR
jgi:hypothetical protein